MAKDEKSLDKEVEVKKYPPNAWIWDKKKKKLIGRADAEGNFEAGAK